MKNNIKGILLSNEPLSMVVVDTEADIKEDDPWLLTTCTGHEIKVATEDKKDKLNNWRKIIASYPHLPNTAPVELSFVREWVESGCGEIECETFLCCAECKEKNEASFCCEFCPLPSTQNKYSTTPTGALCLKVKKVEMKIKLISAYSETHIVESGPFCDNEIQVGDLIANIAMGTAWVATDFDVITIKPSTFIEHAKKFRRLLPKITDPTSELENEAVKTFDALIEQHLKWTYETFPKATSIGALLHLKREIAEVESDISNNAPKAQKIEEYADCFGCLFSSMSREGITLPELVEAFQKKLTKNMGRTWRYNNDGSYSHIKQQ